MPHLHACHAMHLTAHQNRHPAHPRLMPWSFHQGQTGEGDTQEYPARTCPPSSPTSAHPHIHIHAHALPPLLAITSATMPPQIITTRATTCKEGRSVPPWATEERVEVPTPCFFKGAQRHVALPLVSYAWGTMNMTMPNVMPPSSGVEEKPAYEETNVGSSSSLTVSHFVSASRPWQGAENQDTVPSSVLKHRRTELITPYKPSAWHISSTGTACSRSIQIYTIASCRVSTLASLAYLEHMFLIIIHLLISSLHNMKKLWKKNSRKEDISVLSQEKNWKPSLDLSSPPPSPLFPNQENQGNITWSMTSPTRVNLPQIQFHLSIPPSAHTIFPAHGELFPPSALSSIDFCQDHKPPSGTLQTIPVHHDQWPGLVIHLHEDDSFTANTCNNFGLTLAGGVHELLADAGADLFRANGMGQYQNGSTITYFLGSTNATSTHTTTSTIHGAKPLPPTEGEYMKEVAYGTGVIPCLMVTQKNTTKTWPPPWAISPMPQHTPPMTLFTHMLTTTSTTSQKGWA